MYCWTITENSVNWCRRALFNGKSLDKITQTKNTLIEHIKRAVYQAGCVTEAVIKRCSAKTKNLYFQSPINNKEWIKGLAKSLKHILREFILSKADSLQIVSLLKNELIHMHFSTILPNLCFTKHLSVAA